MNKQEFLRLLDKYLDGSADAAEQEMLFRYYEHFQENSTTQLEPELAEAMEQNMLLRLEDAVAKEQRVVPLYRKIWFKASAAAAIVLLVISLLYFPTTSKPSVAQAQTSLTEKLPVAHTGKITLALANGRTIKLDSLKNGLITRQGMVALHKQDGALVYTAAAPATHLSFNRLSTDRGAHVQLVLPDGTKVTLNAASSLRYPIQFPIAERRVEVDGEAYFEVAKEKSRPFKVVITTPGSTAKGAIIEVLGTHFNINAYSDEANMRTTLLEGSVLVRARETSTTKAASRQLLPGQQARVGSDTAVDVKPVDVLGAVAWQQNLFYFDGADSREIMRQLARWYNLDVVYRGTNSQKRFSGKISRLMALTDVLEILEQGGLKFDVQGRKITLRS